jgi:uncharacterized protein YhaN
MKTLLNKIENLKSHLADLKETKKSDLIKDIKTEVDLPYYFDDDITSFDELRDKISDNGGFDIEIIYYYRAMEYLMENDSSLQESLSLAAEYGYTPDKLNSEILASLLVSQNERSEFDNNEKDFDDYFETVEEINNHTERLDEIVEELECLNEEEDNSEIIQELTEEVEEIESEYE